MARTVTKRKRIKAVPKAKKARAAAKKLTLPKLINLNTASDLLSKVEDDARKALQDIITRSKKAQKQGSKRIEKIVQQAKKNGYLKALQSSKQWKYVQNVIKDMKKSPMLAKKKRKDLKDQLVLRIRKIDSGKKLATSMKKYVGDKILVGLYEIEAALKIPTNQDLHKLEGKVKRLQTEVTKISKRKARASTRAKTKTRRRARASAR